MHLSENSSLFSYMLKYVLKMIIEGKIHKYSRFNRCHLLVEMENPPFDSPQSEGWKNIRLCGQHLFLF